MSLSANEELTIDGLTYRVQPSSCNDDIPFCIEAGQADVYKLAELVSNRSFALKIFHQGRFDPVHLTLLNNELRKYAHLPGLIAANRRVLPQKSVISNNGTNMNYAVFMPWIEGFTWYEILINKDDPDLINTTGKAIQSILNTFVQLEEHQLVHCDLAADNIVIEAGTGQVSLVDLDFMYGFHMPEPYRKPGGHLGYQHKTSASIGNWHAYGDRFAGAILLTEMLCWREQPFRQVHNVDLESFFEQKELQKVNPKSTLASTILRQLYGAEVESLFARAWNSERPEDCPSLTEWATSLNFSPPREVDISTELSDVLESFEASIVNESEQIAYALPPTTEIMEAVHEAKGSDSLTYYSESEGQGIYGLPPDSNIISGNIPKFN